MRWCVKNSMIKRLALAALLAMIGTTLTAYCNNTILAAQSALRRMYIDKDLDHPVLILLIDTDTTYRRLSKDWLN